MEKIKNIYMLLPRFVPATEIRYKDGRFLSSIPRSFEHKGTHFDFVIIPATICDSQNISRNYYPGEREQSVENVLRKMAVDENPNFIKEDLALVFSLRHLLDYINGVGNRTIYTGDEIELSLDILADVKYKIRRGSVELNFYAIEELRRVTEDGKIFYRVRFSYMFLGDNKVFDYNFGRSKP